MANFSSFLDVKLTFIEYVQLKNLKKLWLEYNFYLFCQTLGCTRIIIWTIKSR